MKAKTMQRVYLREAGVMLAMARLAVRFLPPARLFAWADRPPRRSRRFASEEARWVAWAIERASARNAMKFVGLPRALAAHAMLRRRGLASRLCLGVARDGGEVSLDAWIELDGDEIVGDAGGFTPLAAFGGGGR